MRLPTWYRDKPDAAERFRRIVTYARDNNPFYKRWLRDLDNIPILDRPTFQAHNEEILNGYIPNTRTSGSSGIPVLLHVTAERKQINRTEQEKFVAEAGGRMRTVQILNQRDFQKNDNLIDIRAPIEEQLAFLQGAADKSPEAVLTMPANAEMLANEVLARELDMSHIRRCVVYGQTFDQDQVELVQRAFPNARIWSSYSAKEFGAIATPCPFEPGYFHFRDQKLGIELLGEDGEPCQEGEAGRVVVTDFFNRATPFIRYDLYDYAVRVTCPCGTISAPATNQIVGKVIQLMVRRDGRRVQLRGGAFAKIKGVRQFQVIQDAIEDFTINIVSEVNVDDDVYRALEHGLGYLPDKVTVNYVDAIAAEPSGKFFRTLCRV